MIFIVDCVSIVTNKGGLTIALIKCSECGKENVSDSAISCPESRFVLKKNYVEKLLKEQNEETQARIKKSIKAKMTKYLVLLIL